MTLDQEDPLEKEMATPVFLPGKFKGQRSLGAATVHGVTKESNTTEQLSNLTIFCSELVRE